jgi:hypothetical protein
MTAAPRRLPRLSRNGVLFTVAWACALLPLVALAGGTPYYRPSMAIGWWAMMGSGWYLAHRTRKMAAAKNPPPEIPADSPRAP